MGGIKRDNERERERERDRERERKKERLREGKRARTIEGMVRKKEYKLFQRKKRREAAGESGRERGEEER